MQALFNFYTFRTCVHQRDKAKNTKHAPSCATHISEKAQKESFTTAMEAADTLLLPRALQMNNNDEERSGPRMLAASESQPLKAVQGCRDNLGCQHPVVAHSV